MIQINAAQRLHAAKPPKLMDVAAYFKHYGVDVGKNVKNAGTFGYGNDEVMVALKTPYPEATQKLTKALGKPQEVGITMGMRVVRGFVWKVPEGDVAIYNSEARLMSGKTRPNMAVLRSRIDR